MEVNNFDLILGWLKFDEPTDFYHLQLIVRKKDNVDAGKNNRLLKAYYIKSKEHLMAIREEVMKMCETFGARAYINPGRKNMQKCMMNTIAGLAIRASKGSCEKIYREWDSQAGLLKPEESAWIVDVDDVDLPNLEAIKACINSLQPNNVTDKILLEVPTVSGVHLITSSFNLAEFWRKYPSVAVHKNNPTLLYFKSKEV